MGHHQPHRKKKDLFLYHWQPGKQTTCPWQLTERTANFAFVPSLPKIPTAFRTLVSDTGCTFSQPFESQQLRKTRFNLFSVQYLQFIITDADSCICCHGSQFHAWPADSVIPVFAVLIRTSLWSWNTHTQLSNSVPTAGSCSHELIHRLR